MENLQVNPTQQSQATPPITVPASALSTAPTPPFPSPEKPMLQPKTIAPVSGAGFTDNGNSMMLQAHHGFLVRRSGWVGKHVTGDGKGNLVVMDNDTVYAPWHPTDTDLAATDWSVQK